MKANFVLPALILAKLVCCVALPLAAAGALGGVAAWFAEVPAVAWALLALALAAGGATAWRHSANRAMLRHRCRSRRRSARAAGIVTSVVNKRRTGTPAEFDLLR